MRGSRMPEPWNSATQVARNLKGIDLDRISIIQIDLEEDSLPLQVEGAEVAFGAITRLERVTAHGRKQRGLGEYLSDPLAVA